MSVLGAGHVCKQSVQYNAAANCTTTRPSGKTTLLFDATPQHNTAQHNTTQLHLSIYLPIPIPIYHPLTLSSCYLKPYNCNIFLPLLNLLTLFHASPPNPLFLRNMNHDDKLTMDLVPPSEHLCYVRCNFCNTVLAVTSSLNTAKITHQPSLMLLFILYTTSMYDTNTYPRFWKGSANMISFQHQGLWDHLYIPIGKWLWNILWGKLIC